jgi:hypothetical protein
MASRRRRLRLLAGGLVGGAIVIVGRQRRRALPGGLRAFEGAPCFRADHGDERHGQPPEGGGTPGS